MNTKMFLFQIIVASIANIIAGIILSERKEGNKPSSKSLVTINFETNNFNIHWSSKAIAVIWLLILFVMGVVLLRT